MEGAGSIGGLLARSSGYSSGNWTSHAYYHVDGNGNVTCPIGSNQSLVASYRYDPFGNTISKGGSLADANVYRFSSKECHTNSLMYYYGHRFYDPNLQRWINRDPLGDESVLGGFLGTGSRMPDWYLRNEAMQNPYGFTRNSPMTFVDSDGRFVIVIAVGGGILIEIGQGVTIGLAVCMVIPSCRVALENALARVLDRVCRARPAPRPNDQTSGGRRNLTSLIFG
jgi:RHS repeat-associated protein